MAILSRKELKKLGFRFSPAYLAYARTKETKRKKRELRRDKAQKVEVK